MGQAFADVFVGYYDNLSFLYLSHIYFFPICPLLWLILELEKRHLWRLLLYSVRERGPLNNHASKNLVLIQIT
jgi:hypothetical protein